MLDIDVKFAKKTIEDIADRFKSNLPEFESNEYLESQLRTDFIDEFFKALGWDVINKNKLSRLDREVLVEKGDTSGRPDYSFRVNGQDRFFVETKSPSKGTNKPEDIFQAKSYGWNTTSVNIVVLTDFRSFKVFDTTIKPDLKQPQLGLIFELNFDKYSSNDFDQLWLFSKEKVVSGSLDELSSKDPSAKRLRIPVNEALIDQMTLWREELAKSVYKNNPEIDVRELNDIVQRLLDRLVFIRLLEDRKIIDVKTLKEIADTWKEGKHRDIQAQLNLQFKQLNNDFNGEIFKPHECERISYDSQVVADIIDALYPPKSPYNFAVIGVELLGSIYEKYLGKTIRLTEKRVKVEEKPEVRKAGGVFYTPKWVVSYVVENTVGKLIEGKSAQTTEGIHILDPACGSGSFLIEAVNRLFQHYLKYYEAYPRDAKRGELFPNVVVTYDDDGNTIPRLSIYRKGEIIKNNIFGVDIDPQAVEITMMSLYIKILEGERALPHNKELLPSLSNNIRCGNSLVGFDFLEQTTLIQNAEKEKANCFDWYSKETGFGSFINDKRGFDVIIGNPPYIRIQTMKEWAPKEVEYFSRKYETAESGNYDIYVIFVEKAVQLLDSDGLFGFILPNKFFVADYGQNLRNLIAKNKLLREIINFTDQQVFNQVTTYTNLLFLSKIDKKSFKYVEIRKLDSPSNQLAIIKKNNVYSNGTLRIGFLPITGVSALPWQFGFEEEATLMKKLNRKDARLSTISGRIFQGIVTGADSVFIVKDTDSENGQKLVDVFSKELDKSLKLESQILKPLLKGQEIKRYSTPNWRYHLIFPYNIENGKAKLIPKGQMQTKYPRTWEYLNENKRRLLARDRGKLKVEWYAFSRNQNIDQFYEPKVMTQVLASRASYTLDRQGLYYFVGGGNAGGYGIKLKSTYNNLDLRYITGLLNSKLLDFYLKKISTPFRGGFFSYAKRFIEQLPIHLPKMDNASDKESYEKICSYVQIVLIATERSQNANNDSAKQVAEREAKVFQEKIDQIVYDLYGLNESERNLVESTFISR